MFATGSVWWLLTNTFMVPFERSIVDDDLQSVNIPMLQFSNGMLTHLTKHKTTKPTRKERKKENKTVPMVPMHRQKKKKNPFWEQVRTDQVILISFR